jgi:hypothetical protein
MMSEDAYRKLLRTVKSISLFSFTGLILLIALMSMHIGGPGIGAEVHGVCGGGIPPEKPTMLTEAKPDIEKILGIEFDEQKGEEVFNNNCESCHAINERVTGPALRGIRKRLPQPSQVWLKNLLSHHVDVTANKYYKALQQDYNDANVHKRMTFRLTDNEIQALTGYLFLFE